MYYYFVFRKPVQLVRYTLASRVPIPVKLFWEDQKFPFEVYSYFLVKYKTTHVYSYFGCVFLWRGVAQVGQMMRSGDPENDANIMRQYAMLCDIL